MGKIALGNRCSGMTLVEVLVFSTLALLVLGSSFPLLSFLMASDRAHEERLAASLFLQTAGEQLQTVPFNALTNGFTRINSKKYKKVVNPTNFYKTVSAKYRVYLFPKTDPRVGNYYQASLELKWSTEINGRPKRNHNDKIILLLLPDV